MQQQDLLAQAEGSIAGYLVDVYRALGGGWQIRLCKPTVTELTAGLGPESVPDATGAAAPLVSSNSSATGAPDAQAATTEAARGPQPLRTALQESPWQENSLRTN